MEKVFAAKSDQQLWSYAQVAYGEHKLDRCYEITQYIQKRSKAKTLPYERKLFSAKIQKEYLSMKQFYDYFNESGYILDQDEDGIKMYYKVNQA